jgi:hypothetical protein
MHIKTLKTLKGQALFYQLTRNRIDYISLSTFLFEEWEFLAHQRWRDAPARRNAYLR